MRPLTLSAITATSALGRGLAPMLAALGQRRSGLRPCDFAGVAVGGHIGRVDGLEDHAIEGDAALFDCRNNRLADLALRQDGFTDAVAEAVERYGADRIAVVMGTSTSGVQAGEDAYRGIDPTNGTLPDSFDYERTQDLFSLARFVRLALGLRGPAVSVSIACASSAKSFADAHHLIESGVCDAAVVGGVDTLCRMTLHGFAALDLISPTPCRPCDAERSGISIGEAGGFALVERAADSDSTLGRIDLLGFGASSDGHHMSAPHPEGRGAIAAMRQALHRAGVAPDSVDYVNLHGTGTRANDAMEDVAVSAVFGSNVACSSTKGWTGHTLGASGILEAAIAALCLRNQFIPGCLAVEQIDPAFTARVVIDNQGGPVRRILSNAFGFGGINCSLLFGTPA